MVIVNDIDCHCEVGVWYVRDVDGGCEVCGGVIPEQDSTVAQAGTVAGHSDNAGVGDIRLLQKQRQYSSQASKYQLMTDTLDQGLTDGQMVRLFLLSKRTKYGGAFLCSKFYTTQDIKKGTGGVEQI